MRFNNRQRPRSSTDFVKGISSPIPYVIRNELGDWTQYFPTFQDQRQDGYDTFDCWDYAGVKVIETQLNFLLQQGMFPKEAVDFFTSGGYLDQNGKFAISEEFYAALATYPDGTPVRDGGNDQIELPKLVKQWGILPRADFRADPSLSFPDQQAFDDYFYDKSRITPAMYAKAKQALQYVSIQYEWIGQEGVMPPIQDVRATLLQSPLQIGLPTPQNPAVNWNVPLIQYDGGQEANHSVALRAFPTDNMARISDQYNPEDKTLSADYFIPMVSHIYVSPILTPPYVAPETAIPLPDPNSLWNRIWQAVWSWFHV